jgi:hypothetical protein
VETTFSDKKTPFASYHPELDETELLLRLKEVQSLIGSGVADNAGTFRYTIHNIYNVTVFNGPRRHMEELQRVFGYLQSTQVEASH